MKSNKLVNSESDIRENLKRFSSLSPCAMEPFWGHMMPAMNPDDPFWKAPEGFFKNAKPVLFVSGPGRHGNHLAHSMVDNHPQIARIGGEDAFLAAFFKSAVEDQEKAKARLRSVDILENLFDWSGHGVNKWKLTAEMSRGGNVRETAVWAGVHDEKQFVSDYQDTVVSVNYEAFEKTLNELALRMRKADTFVEIFWMYLEALSKLDPLPSETLAYPFIYVGSGMRAEMKFLLSLGAPIKCVAPLRPFETFYYSFAKGRMRSEEIDSEVLQLAWEHWYHKVVDYLILKQQYPDQVCLVNFTHLIESPEESAREICHFLGVDFHPSCLVPTSMGIPTKGNSSFPKSEDRRGTFYKDSLEKKLPQNYWPELYPGLWNMVTHLAV